jgi:hypothetical protein
MTLDEIKDIIKQNLEISISTKSRGSECSYNEQTYVELYFAGELISKAEIEGLGKDY